MNYEAIKAVAHKIWEWRIKQEPAINGSEESDWELAKVYLYEYKETTLDDFCGQIFLNRRKGVRPLIGGY